MTGKREMYSINHLIEAALREDIGPGDITTENLVGNDQTGTGYLIAKEPLLIAGLDVARETFQYLDSDLLFKSEHVDGDRVKEKAVLLEVQGSLRSLLLGERTALNFLQRISGIATCVRSYVDALGDKKIRLVDTRKTVPGWRVLEKYAVRVGGAHNHRMGLFDGVLIKDNHIAVCGSIKKAVEKIKDRVSHLVKIEIEVSDLAEVKDALEAGADVIMLDNMDLDAVREAVYTINGKAEIEVSGGININNLSALADTGVDIISVGALTHSARAVDISMKINPDIKI